MRHPRGGALPETAIVLGATLTMLFGMLELGLIGWMQLSSDGAAFVAAHAAVLGNDPWGSIVLPFPQIPSTGLTVAQNAPDPTNVPVDYQASDPNNRHGGLQVVRPWHLQASIDIQKAGIGHVLPQVDLGSGVIEGSMQVSNPGYDLDSTSYNGPSTPNKGYFTDDGNAPPYFIGFRIMKDCTSVAPGGGCTGVQTMTLGMAEYLDGDNWDQPDNGIGPNGVYSAMQIHQNVYAKIQAELDTIAATGVSTTSSSKAWLDPSNDPCVQSVQSWDGQGQSYTWDWSKYPLHPTTPPAAGC